MRCVECEEVITNPLCADCLHTQMRQWLAQRNEEALASQVSSDAPYGEVTCISCGSPMALCTYCTTGEMWQLIRENRTLLAEYLAFFNFDLGHLGWEQEARAWLEVQ